MKQGYDAEGNRVAKGTIQTWGSCDPTVNGFLAAGNETDYVLGSGDEQVTELAQDANGSMNWQRTYVYAAGSLIATYDPAPNPQYIASQYNPSDPTVDPPSIAMPSFRLTDWLGTMRATTDAWGVVQSTCTGLPFGDGVACSGDIPDPHHFTGKERDTESGNDYFGARYYSSAMGRFLSPDWSAKAEPVPYAKMDDPQSLNLYAYMMNNPLAGVDADGHDGPSSNGASTGLCAVMGGCENGQGQPPAQQQDPQLVVTMTVTSSNIKGGNGIETDATYGISTMDSNGKVAPLDPTAGDHSITMTETLDASKTKGSKPQICNTGCTDIINGSAQTRTDRMAVTGKNVAVLDKRFTIDGNKAKVYDPVAKKTGDYIHEVNSVKGGTVFTYMNDNP